MNIKKIGANLGAEVGGIGITDLDGELVQGLRRAFREHGVLVFRDQAISDEEQVAFSEHFGTIEMTLPSDPYGGGGPINRITNVDEDGEIIPAKDSRSLYQAGNMLWHADGSFRPLPLKASFLAAKEVPPSGGETEFASVRAAFADLPEERKAELEGLVAEHSMAYSRSQIAPDLMTDEFSSEAPPVSHPLIRRVPETGEKMLHVGSYASHILGWPLEKGRALLSELLEWATQPRYVISHSWRANDLVMWDNRCCLHRGRPWAFDDYRRVMHRTTLKGSD